MFKDLACLETVLLVGSKGRMNVEWAISEE